MPAIFAVREDLRPEFSGQVRGGVVDLLRIYPALLILYFLSVILIFLISHFTNRQAYYTFLKARVSDVYFQEVRGFFIVKRGVNEMMTLRENNQEFITLIPPSEMHYLCCPV